MGPYENRGGIAEWTMVIEDPSSSPRHSLAGSGDRTIAPYDAYSEHAADIVILLSWDRMYSYSAVGSHTHARSAPVRIQDRI